MATRSDQKLELIGRVPMFSACSDKELRKIASLTEHVEVPAGQVLAKEGTPGREAFFIVDGQAEVTLRGERLATLGPGEFVGEMALLDQGPRSATVVAGGPMSLLVLEARDFGRLLEEVPIVTKKVMRGLAQRLRDMETSPNH